MATDGSLQVRDRIRELRRVRAGELAANPKNWRRHPERQRRVVRALLQELGFVNALLARETPDGLVLIDGHLRREEVAADAAVPVLILDVTEDEADAILATLDPSAALAEADAEAFRTLSESVDLHDEDVLDMIKTLAEESAPPVPPDDFPDKDQLDTAFCCPRCGYAWSGKPK